jgi:transcriptional regulator with XRE-family HTH domain
MSFGQHVKALRQQSRLSQRDLAIRAGANYATISRLGSGEISGAGVELVWRLARAFDVPPSVLVSHEPIGASFRSSRLHELLARLSPQGRQLIEEFATFLVGVEGRIITSKEFNHGQEKS